MSTGDKKKKSKKAEVVKAPTGANFYKSLDALEKVVKVAVDGEQPDANLLGQLDYYLATLQDGADLVNVVLYQHSVTKLVDIMRGIGNLHELLLDKEKLKKAVEEDKDYAVKLLSALYKEGGATMAFMDSKGSKLFDTDGLKKSPMLATTSDSAEVSKKVSKLPASKREELRGIVSKLLQYNDAKTNKSANPTLAVTETPSTSTSDRVGEDAGDKPTE